MKMAARIVRFVWLLPRNFFVALLLGYRKVISPLYGDVCRFYPTCSAYGLGQVQQRGVLLGSAATLWRILRCNPWSSGGVDSVKPGATYFKVLPNGFVVPK
jgi:putative membrane protein insertion efficiency factor